MSSILEMSASDLGRAIGVGTLDPVEIAQVYLQSIEEHHEAKRIYTMTTKKRALAEAEAASIRARTGQRLSLLDGVPILSLIHI